MPTGREDGDITMKDGEKVDISKIRPGDRVTLEVWSTDDRAGLIFVSDNDGSACFRITDIATHHPAPREFQVGDRVRHAVEETALLGTVRGVDGARLWVRWDNSPINWNADADDLTLVEGGE